MGNGNVVPASFSCRIVRIPVSAALASCENREERKKVQKFILLSHKRQEWVTKYAVLDIVARDYRLLMPAETKWDEFEQYIALNPPPDVQDPGTQ